MKRVALPTWSGSAWRGFLPPALPAALALVAAVLGALYIGPSTGGVVGGVEGLSSAANRLLGDVGALLPLGFAFGAGMVSTVNPCGFAMLPAYLGLYLGSKEESGIYPSPVHRLGRALLVGSVVTAGFVLLFGAVGVLVSGGVRLVVSIFPWIGLAVGVLLAIAGAWLLRGGKLYSGLAGRAAAHLGDPRRGGVGGYFLFGVSYGTASLSCTLPIFLAVVGTSLASGGFLGGLGQFVLYALGMGLVVMLLTLASALFKGALVGVLRRALPYIQPASAVLMILAGAYIVFYWLTIGGLLAVG